MTLRDADQWFSAIRERNVDVIRSSAERFAGSRTTNGDTGLMLAARLNIPEIVFILAPLERGHFNSDGDTALKIALDSKNHACIDELLHYEIHFKVSNGSTPLHTAVQQNLLGYIPVLVHHWKNTSDSHGMTALDLAAHLGYDEAVEYLIKHGSFTIMEIERASDIARKANHHTLVQDFSTIVSQFSESSYSKTRRALTSHHRQSRSITDSQTTTLSQNEYSQISFSRTSNRSGFKASEVPTEQSEKPTNSTFNSPELYNFNCPRCRTMFESMAKRIKNLTTDYHKLQKELAQLRADNEKKPDVYIPNDKPVALSTAVTDTTVFGPSSRLPFLSFDSDKTLHKDTGNTSISMVTNLENPQSSMLASTTLHGYPGRQVTRNNYSGCIESANHFPLTSQANLSSTWQSAPAPLHSPEYHKSMAQSSSRMRHISTFKSGALTPDLDRITSSNLNRRVSPIGQTSLADNISIIRQSSY